MCQFTFINYIYWLSIALFTPVLGYDLTVVGMVRHSDGLARISIGVIDLLKEDLSVNCISTDTNLNDISEDVRAIVLDPDKSPGRVCVYCSPLWYSYNSNLFNFAPDSDIKIAYSMLESTRIPPEWTEILNSKFDAVVVPDQFLVKVYKDSGVVIPIFVLPLGMYLDEYFERKIKESPSDPFVFGTTVSCDERKNTTMLINSFAEVFGNSEAVVLKLNSRHGTPDVYRKLIESLEVTNIIFTNDVLSKDEYLDFIGSFDCFINISKGEGFSLCPREALALGIPCILTDNSSQTTICNSGLVRVVASNILEPTDYWGMFGGQQVGYFSNCRKKDVKEAMFDVYHNYADYLLKARGGPKWVAQYHWPNLKKKYLNLLKPMQVRFGSKNMITDSYLMTDSEALYKKYLKLPSEAPF